MDHSPILSAFAYATTETQLGTTAGLRRIDELLSTIRTIAEQEELLRLIELHFEDAKLSRDNRGVWRWYRTIRAMAGNPIIGVTD
jgi:hypothetical protein